MPSRKHGSFKRLRRGLTAGNSRRTRQSFFRRSEVRAGGPPAPPPAVHARAGVPTVNVYGAQTVYRQQASNWTTLNAYFGATVHANAGGTYATTWLHSEAKLMKTENTVPVTLTNTEIGSGCRIHDPAKRITYTNPIVYPEGQEQFQGGAAD